MPKLRTPPSVMQERHILALIDAGKRMTGTETDELALAVGMGRSTFYKRLKKPLNFTGIEFIKMGRKLKIDPSEFLKEAQ